jgi:hypothetical protein
MTPETAKGRELAEAQAPITSMTMGRRNDAEWEVREAWSAAILAIEAEARADANKVAAEQAATIEALREALDASPGLWSHSVHCASETTWKAPCDCGLGQRRHDFRALLADTAKASEDGERVVWRLLTDDAEEGWYELGLYLSKTDADADLAAVEAAYPGRPYWIDFRVDRLAVSASRRTPDELATALGDLADRSEIDTTWRDPNASESWQSEHGEPRPASQESEA